MSRLKASLVVVAEGKEGTYPALVFTTYRVPQYAAADGSGDVSVQQIVINCGECACRTLQEARIKLNGLSDVLLTQSSALCVGGLPSLLFHLSDRGAGAVNLRGPAGLAGYYSTIRPFVSRRYPEISIIEGEELRAKSDIGWLDLSNSSGWGLLRQASNSAGASESAGIRIKAIPLFTNTDSNDSDGPPTKRAKGGTAAAPGEGGDARSAHSHTRPPGIAYLLCVSGPFAASVCKQPADLAADVDALGDAYSVASSSSSEDASSGKDSSGGESSSSSDEANESSSDDSSANSSSDASASASLPRADGQTSRYVLIFDASGVSGGGELTAAVHHLRSAMSVSELALVHAAIHMDCPAAPGGTAANPFDASYRAAFTALCPSAVHFTISDRQTSESAVHFPAASAQASLLGAVEPHLWPLGAGKPAAATSSAPSTSAASVWPTLSARSAIDLGSMLVEGPQDSKGQQLDDVGAALALAYATGFPAFSLPSPGTSPSAPAITPAVTDDNEIDLDDCNDKGPSSTSPALPTIDALLPPNLLFLGTGAAAPSKLRSCSGLLLSWPGLGGNPVDRLLLDCGEGALGRLQQLATATAQPLGAVLGSIHAVAVSHMHADHHSGLLAVLAARAAAASTAHPLLVLGPPALGPVMAGYARMLPRQNSASGSAGPPYLFAGPEPAAIGMLLAARLPWVTAWTRPTVAHCRDAVADILTLAFPFSASVPDRRVVLAYSGDTRPCGAFVSAVTAAAHGAAQSLHHPALVAHGSPYDRVRVLVVHEATMNDDRADDAAAKRHSTVGEALGVTKAVQAQLHSASPRCFAGTVLTHFSQRYPRLVTQQSASAAIQPPPSSAGNATGIPGGQPPSRFLMAHDGLTVPLAFDALDAVVAASEGVTARVNALWTKAASADENSG